MAFTPISNTVPQYSKNAGGASAAGYFLKFYADGTTTPISMATDSTGGTLLAKCELDSLGYPTTDGTNIFIPHIDQTYKLALYTNATDADNNTLASAAWVVDDLVPGINGNVADLVTKAELIAAGGTGLITHTQSGTDYNLASYLQNRYVVNVKDFGALADGVTDNYSAIEAALVVARANKGKVWFPANKDGSASDYNYSQTLQYNASDAIIEGESTSVRLVYTGTGTGLACKITPAGTSIERWGLRNITLYSATGAIGLDFTGGNYGNYENIEINYTAANAEMLYAIGNTGAGPYFNKFDGLTFFGSAGRTQDAIVMKGDVSGNLADGPNANVFTNIKRGASLRRLINLVSGTGNLFTNIGGESIEDALIVLNEAPSFADAGTSTSTTNYTLTDTSKTWSTVLGDPLNFTNDSVTLTSGIPGETRRIVSNTATTLTLDKPFSQYPGATVTYTISESRAVKNMFVNVRQEGLNTSNPDGIRCMAGARGNEVNHVEIGSLGTGVVFDDQAQDQTNKVSQGDLIIESFTVENIGASANQDLILRSGGIGGIRAGSNMCIEYTEVLAIGYTAGTATITTDHAGATVGAGTFSSVCKIDSVNTESAYIDGDKIMRSTTNNGIFCNITTDVSFGAATDLIVKVAYRVQ